MEMRGIAMMGARQQIPTYVCPFSVFFLAIMCYPGGGGEGGRIQGPGHRTPPHPHGLVPSHAVFPTPNPSSFHLAHTPCLPLHVLTPQTLIVPNLHVAGR